MGLDSDTLREQVSVELARTPDQFFSVVEKEYAYR
jgi:hypothetical protein